MKHHGIVVILLKAQSSKLKAQSSKLKAQSSKLKAQSSKLKAQTQVAMQPKVADYLYDEKYGVRGDIT